MAALAASFKDRMLNRGFTAAWSHGGRLPGRSYMETLQMLEKHLALRPFLFGQRPSLADFGLAGQLYQCFSDVLAGELMRLHAPHVALWCEVPTGVPHGDGDGWWWWMVVAHECS
eukprot:Skav214196  [mRNA]  locus=scaffold2153:110538:112111:+ [translate_table: standard]